MSPPLAALPSLEKRWAMAANCPGGGFGGITAFYRNRHHNHADAAGGLEFVLLLLEDFVDFGIAHVFALGQYFRRQQQILVFHRLLLAVGFLVGAVEFLQFGVVYHNFIGKGVFVGHRQTDGARGGNAAGKLRHLGIGNAAVGKDFLQGESQILVAQAVGVLLFAHAVALQEVAEDLRAEVAVLVVEVGIVHNHLLDLFVGNRHAHFFRAFEQIGLVEQRLEHFFAAAAAAAVAGVVQGAVEIFAGDGLLADLDDVVAAAQAGQADGAEADKR